MAHEELMKTTGKNIVYSGGYFHVRDNCPSDDSESGGSYSVVVSNQVLVSSSGPDSKERASELVSRLQSVFEEWVGEGNKNV